MQITILDAVHSIIPRADVATISPCVAYEREGWHSGPFKKERKVSMASMIDGRNGRFLTGLIPRITKFCQNKGIDVCIEGEHNLTFDLEPRRPSLPGITLRPDQIQTTQSVIKHGRGVIKNATGTGKTVLAGAICSMWPDLHTIFLCHTLDLLQQAERAFKQQFGFQNIVVLGGGSNQFEWPNEPTIVIATVQTFYRLDILAHCEWADIIIVDECHHLNDNNGMIAKVLKQCIAPIRIGLSAELPKTDQERLTLEGFLGPVIGEFTYGEAVKAGVLAKPLINLIPVPYSDEIGECTRYYNTVEEGIVIAKGMYQKGIIENKARNYLALEEAKKSIDKGDSVLILTARDTQHGYIIREMAKNIFDMDIPFIYGDTSKEDRVIAKDSLDNKDLKCVIANVVWKEGINIRTLNHVINVGGEKFPTQIVGRGSRATETKKWVHITDFLDPYKWLSHHSVMRLIVYAEEGWLNQHNFHKGG
jgi:superfamily II DNA or RNA helicase